MLGSKAPNNDANGLFRATHSHNPDIFIFLYDRRSLEQTCDLSVVCYINSICCRYFRQSRHGHYCTRQSDNESCTGTDIDFSDMDIKILRSSKLLRIIWQGILILRHTYREIWESHLFDLCDLLWRSRFIHHISCTIDFLCDRTDFIFQRKFFTVKWMETAFLCLQRLQYFLSQCDAAFSAFFPFLLPLPSFRQQI